MICHIMRWTEQEYDSQRWEFIKELSIYLDEKNKLEQQQSRKLRLDSMKK